MRYITFVKLEENAYNLLKEVIGARDNESTELHHSLLYMEELIDEMRYIIDREYEYNDFND